MAQSDWLNEVPLSPLNQDGDSHENLKQIKCEIHVIQRFLHTLIIERDNKITQFISWICEVFGRDDFLLQ